MSDRDISIGLLLGSQGKTSEGDEMVPGIMTAIALLLGSGGAAQEMIRSKYQRVINQKYPGFRILEAEDFDPFVRPHLLDGRSGSLLLGHFNFDAYLDFAAWIRPDMTKRFESDHPYDYYEAKIVTCFGRADGASFRCEATDIWLTLPNDTTLDLVRPGSHKCYAEKGMSRIVTLIDSVGSSSEKGASFVARNRNGMKYTCVTSD
jgi:hypothetical protein